ncbi:MAG TPA: VCBS repeat-containing protein [Nocardioidaceae bacterium]|nr:VCBS repeat-containing protein [Nocardioidaceae bacterium]
MDRAEHAGLALTRETWGAIVVDFNRDGAQDVLISRHGRGAKLWKNNGRGRYQRAAVEAWPRCAASGKPVDRHGCAWADVDRNGLPDASCSTGRFRANFVKTGRDSELWLQRRPGRFRDVGTRWHVGNACGRGRHVVFLHANRDRYIERTAAASEKF